MMEPSELERRARERAQAERVRVVKVTAPIATWPAAARLSQAHIFNCTSAPGAISVAACAAFDYRGICKHVAALKMRLAREKQRHEAV